MALLLWGLRLVRTGVFRALGADLRRWVGLGTRNRVVAATVGVAVTVTVQSSTATAVMAAATVGQGAMGTAAALAVVLGADVGTAAVARLLSFDLHWLSPLLIAAGGALFAFGAASRHRRALARTLVGLGLVLLALRLLGEATLPIRGSELVGALLAALAAAPVVAVLAAAGGTVLLHSSLAMVLLVAALADGGLLDLGGAVALVLGANLGGAVPALLATAHDGVAARRVPLANMAMRATGVLVALPFVAALPAGPATAPAVLLAHITFNGALLLVFLPLIGPVARAMEAALPDPDLSAEASGPRHLDESALEAPSVALACAVRETLRLGDVVEDMLRRSLEALRSDDEREMAEVSRMDDTVDTLHSAIKLYLVKLGREHLDEADGRRAGEVLAFAINLEHIGDIIDKNLMELATKKARHGVRLAPDDMAAVEAMHRRTLENLRTALGVFIAEDPRLARQLIGEKDAVRRLERGAAEAHLERMRTGRSAGLEASALFLDVLRDLKRVNAHAASVAYPILEKGGELRGSRLRSEGGFAALRRGDA